MTRWMRSMHKWVGLVLAVQFVLWMASGLVMSLLDHERVEGEHHRANHAQAAKTWPRGTLSPSQVLAAARRPVEGLETRWVRDQPVYRLSEGSSVWLVRAADGRPLRVDAVMAAAIAAADYVGEGAASAPEPLARPTSEVRGHEGPIWRVAFRDADDTTLYISAWDGRILERRNRSWRLFDVFWMLHIMDYGKRENFNNPLVIMAASGGLWIALSGVWLLVTSFRLVARKRLAPLSSDSAHKKTRLTGQPGLDENLKQND